VNTHLFVAKARRARTGSGLVKLVAGVQQCWRGATNSCAAGRDALAARRAS